MTSGLIERNTNGGSLSTMDGETLSKLVLNGDLSQLNPDQTIAYYVYRCKAVGLDPATKPFDLLTLNGKKVMYATKECSAQISQRDHLSVTVVESKQVGDIYQVTARASDANGRMTDDIGCVTVKGLQGDALCNAIMKATTKAKRRAILSHAGLGMLDESELETIHPAPATVKQPHKPMVKAPPVSAPSNEAVAESAEPSGDSAKATPEEPTIVVEEPYGPDLKADVVTVKGWAREPKMGTKKDGAPYWKLGFKVLFSVLGREEWLNVWSERKAQHLQANKNQQVSILYSESEYNGKPQYTLEGIDGMEE